MSEAKKIDLWVIITYLVLLTILCIKVEFLPLIIAFFYLFIPSVYLNYRSNKNWVKIGWGLLYLGLFIGFNFDFLVTYNSGWIVTKLLFPWKIFGVLPFDDLIGWVFMTLFILVFYEHFLHHEKNTHPSKHLPFAIIPSIIITIIVIIIYLINPVILLVPYVYLVGGFLAILLPVIFTMYHPKFLAKFTLLSIFFFPLWLIIELICLKYGGWIFPGQYLGIVIINQLVFPVEEMFFWMLFYAVTVVAYYEFYIDGDY